ncbi:hypothetical protein SERLA73DRAFT_43592, partial [Serpula lacrymans var. lacrymans S7.3]
PEGSKQSQAIQFWYSITSTSYNDKTLDILANNPSTQVVIVTIAFGTGIHRPNILKVVNYGLATGSDRQVVLAEIQTM